MKPKEIDKQISNSTRVLRQFKGLKQVDLARTINISEGYYSKIESGRQVFTGAQLWVIKRHMNVDHALFSSLTIYQEKVSVKSLSPERLFEEYRALVRSNELVDLPDEDLRFIIRKLWELSRKH